MLIEKLMSGLWMGDCARRILLTFARRTNLLGPVVRGGAGRGSGGGPTKSKALARWRRLAEPAAPAPPRLSPSA
jgi:hypothetical protein